MAVLAVAEAAGLDTVIVPRLSAVFSAHGIGFSDIAHMSEQKLGTNDSGSLTSAIGELREKVRRDMFSEGFELEDCHLQAWVKINGEEFALDPGAPALSDPVSPGDEMIAGLRAIKAVKRAELPPRSVATPHDARESARRVLVNADTTTQDMPVYRVDDQQPGASGAGPAVIEEDFWTCNVLPGWSFEFTANGDVLFNKLK